ncbi:Protein-glucosylgalactosylhydroxylysine glucosidase [Branchiostoma belcheri]|nr:Protein-glucosylgalactosylhydroxylysine glucosidase [Branchiostoma belcheri]
MSRAAYRITGLGSGLVRTYKSGTEPKPLDFNPDLNLNFILVDDENQKTTRKSPPKFENTGTWRSEIRPSGRVSRESAGPFPTGTARALKGSNGQVWPGVLRSGSRGFAASSTARSRLTAATDSGGAAARLCADGRAESGPPRLRGARDPPLPAAAARPEAAGRQDGMSPPATVTRCNASLVRSLARSGQPLAAISKLKISDQLSMERNKLNFEADCNQIRVTLTRQDQGHQQLRLKVKATGQEHVLQPGKLELLF